MMLKKKSNQKKKDWEKRRMEYLRPLSIHDVAKKN